MPTTPEASAPSSPAPPPPPSAQGDGIGRLVIAFVIGQLGLHAAMAGVRMAAALQVLREGQGAWTVGLLLSLFAAAPVLTAWQSGRLADRHGYHPLVYGAVLLSLAGVAAAFVSTFAEGAFHLGLLCLAAALLGTAANVGMLTIQRTAGLQARDATERMRIFSWLGAGPSFSNVVGPVAIGFMIDGFGFAAGYALMGALPLLTWLAARRVPRASGTAAVVAAAARATAAQGADGAASPRTAWSLLTMPGMRRLLVVNWLMSMSWDVHSFAVPLLGHERGFSASTVGLILGVFTAAVTGIRLAIPLLAHRLSEAVVMRGAMIGTALVLAAYPFAPNAMAMGALAALLGMTLGSVQPMIMTTLHHLTPHDRHGEALALRSMAMNSTSTVMPLVFGASSALVGAAVLFWACGAAVLAGSQLPRRFASRVRPGSG